MDCDKNILFVSGSVQAIETWEPTKLLRWKKQDAAALGFLGMARPVLQQQWFRHGDMKLEWRDVPTQQEDEE